MENNKQNNDQANKERPKTREWSEKYRCPLATECFANGIKDVSECPYKTLLVFCPL